MTGGAPHDLLESGRDPEPRRARTALLAVAVLVAGGLVVARWSGTGDTPAPAPSPTASPTAAPTAGAVPAVATLYVPFCQRDTVYRVLADGTPARLTGTPARGSSVDGGGPVPAGPVGCPDGLVFGPAGVVHVVDGAASRVRVVGDGGVVRTLDGRQADPRRALGLRALLVSPDAVALSRDGTVYVGSAATSRVVRVDETGRLRPLVPPPPRPLTVDEPARGAQLAVLDDLSVLFADGATSHVFRVDRDGRTTVAAGTGVAASTGDGGPAVRAGVDDPRSVALDPAGRLYLSEGAARRVRRVDVDGTISAYAGTGAAPVELRYPGDLAVDPAGDVYVVDLTARAVRRVQPDGHVDTLGS